MCSGPKIEILYYNNFFFISTLPVVEFNEYLRGFEIWTEHPDEMKTEKGTRGKRKVQKCFALIF